MDLSEIAQKQIKADIKRGFSKELRTDAERIAQMMQDTVGLIGEIGEFANLLKKADLSERIEGYDGVSIQSATPELLEELADVIIYVIRLSYVLGGDIEIDLLKKMLKNDERYKYLEK